MNGLLSGLSCLHYDLAPQTVYWALDPPAQQHLDGVVTTSFEVVVLGVLHSLAAGARVVVLEVQSDFRPESYCRDRTGTDLAECTAGAAALFDNMQGVLQVIGAHAPRALFVSAAGNFSQAGVGVTSDAALFWPAAVSRPSIENPADNFITVGALNRDGRTATGYSNINKSSPGAVNIGAPVGGGGDINTASLEEILATLPDGRLTMFSGTSAATPLVAGVAGLVFAVAPMLSGKEVKSLLLQSADTEGIDVGVGGKRINAKSAVDAALQEVFLRAPTRLGNGDCDGNLDVVFALDGTAQSSAETRPGGGGNRSAPRSNDRSRDAARRDLTGAWASMSFLPS